MSIGDIACRKARRLGGTVKSSSSAAHWQDRLMIMIKASFVMIFQRDVVFALSCSVSDLSLTVSVVHWQVQAAKASRHALDAVIAFQWYHPGCIYIATVSYWPKNQDTFFSELYWIYFTRLFFFFFFFLKKKSPRSFALQCQYNSYSVLQVMQMIAIPRRVRVIVQATNTPLILGWDTVINRDLTYVCYRLPNFRVHAKLSLLASPTSDSEAVTYVLVVTSWEKTMSSDCTELSGAPCSSCWGG
jgi:hypothetical protein